MFGFIGFSAVLVLCSAILNISLNIGLIADSKVQEMKTEGSNLLGKRFYLVTSLGIVALITFLFIGDYLTRKNEENKLVSAADYIVETYSESIAKIAPSLTDTSKVGQIPEILKFLSNQKSEFPSVTLLTSGKYDGQLTYLVQQSFSEGENLPMDIVNIDKDTTKTIQGGDTGSSFVVHGFVHGEYFGTHLLVSWFNPSPRTLSWSGDDGTSGTLNLVQGTHLVSVDNLSDVVNINLPFYPSSKIRIANNHLHHSSMFSLDLQGTHNTGNVYLHDTDGDSIPDYFDTNAFIPSDLDSDSDGIVDTRDNCPYYWNQDQSDFDDDGDGDVCDDDVDNDGVSNNQPIDFTGSDECPFENSSAQDLDGDGCIDEQNNTVSDTDGDGVLDDSDTCPGDDLEDMDSDGIPDDCDNFPQDWDNDGVDDETDACQGFDDNNDSDDDGIPLGCDDFPNDTDNDGITNNADNCIFIVNPNQANMDGDAQGDACDADIDGDNITNVAPIHVSNGTGQDSCPYVDATGKDEDRDGCIDEIKPDKCEICKEPVEGNETNTLLDPDDVTTVAAVGGAGAVGGGALALVLSKLRRATRFIGIDDGLEALKHLPKRKKEDAGSDHYFQRGLVRQREMTLSADKNLDDYIEENEKEGVEKK